MHLFFLRQLCIKFVNSIKNKLLAKSRWVQKINRSKGLTHFAYWSDTMIKPGLQAGHSGHMANILLVIHYTFISLGVFTFCFTSRGDPSVTPTALLFTMSPYIHSTTSLSYIPFYTKSWNLKDVITLNEKIMEKELVQFYRFITTILSLSLNSLSFYLLAGNLLVAQYTGLSESRFVANQAISKI